jgi:predicted protein tyrosine phosphatase
MPSTRSVPDSTRSREGVYICSFHTLQKRINQIRPAKLISILGDADSAPFPEFRASDHLKLLIDDVCRPCRGFSHATKAHLKQVFEFTRDWNGRDPILIHCWAGSSRSPAIALAVLLQKFSEDEASLVQRLSSRGPHIRPNELIVSLTDDELRLGGRLTGAVRQIPCPEALQRSDLVKIATGSMMWRTLAGS